MSTTDNFTYSDQDPFVDSKWVSIGFDESGDRDASKTGRILSNRWLNNYSTVGFGPTTGVIYDVFTQAFDFDQYSQCVHHSGDRLGPVVRGSAGAKSHFYMLSHFSTGLLKIEKISDSVATDVASVSYNPPADAVFRLEAIGDGLFGYINGVLKVSGNDPVGLGIGSGQPGVASSSLSLGNSFYVDDWEAGNIAGNDTVGSLVAQASSLSGSLASAPAVFTPPVVQKNYSMAATDWWEFVRYGEYVIATNGTDPIQAILI